MVTVANIMVLDPLTVSPEASVARTIELMEKFKIGGLPVVKEGQLVGIITSRDVRKSHPNRLVADAMTHDVLSIPPHYSLWEAREFMEKHKIERLPVALEGKLLGLVTKAVLLEEFAKRIDLLTGLYCAEYLYHAALKILRQEERVIVLFIDMDNFKEIDKEMGHAEGDIILQRVAGILKNAVEEEIDYLCRYAGDEFAIVTSRSPERAKELGLHLLELVKIHTWPRGVTLTASAGIAVGRRGQRKRESDECRAIRDLINLASLGSTQAKKEKVPLVMMGEIEVA